MDTKIDELCAQSNLSAHQKEFCANLSKVIKSPDIDLLDITRISFRNGGDRLQLALPHLNDPTQTIFVVLSKNSLGSLQVWGFEFVNIFENVFNARDVPDTWVVRISDLLAGKLFLEKWSRKGSVLQTRTSRYFSELRKWTMGEKTRTQKVGGIQFIGSMWWQRSLPKDALHEGRHVCFRSAHDIPKFSAT